MNDIVQAFDMPATLRHARINAFDGERYGVVSPEGHRYWLKPALGCLLQPAVGDSVLISLAGDAGYILSVLERSQPSTSELRVAGNLHLSVPTGVLSIETRDGVSLNAGDMLAIQAKSLIAGVTDANLAVSALKVTGECNESQWVERNDTAVRHSERAVTHSAEYGDSRRRTQGHEDLHAGSVRQQVEKDWSVRGETLDLFAQVTVALDGERIKLG